MLEMNKNYTRGEYVADAIREAVSYGKTPEEAHIEFTALESRVIALHRQQNPESSDNVMGNNALVKEAYWDYVTEMFNEELYKPDTRKMPE